MVPGLHSLNGRGWFCIQGTEGSSLIAEMKGLDGFYCICMYITGTSMQLSTKLD